VPTKPVASAIVAATPETTNDVLRVAVYVARSPTTMPRPDAVVVALLTASVVEPPRFSRARVTTFEPTTNRSTV
jgi:hypothetical protein